MFGVYFYHGTRPGIAGIYNRLVRWWDRSAYSHCEIAFSDGMAGSSSFEDGGVRLKPITFDPKNWDFVPLPAHLESRSRAWFEAHQGEKYDLLGNVHFVLALIRHTGQRWFCSEACAESLGFLESWRYKPSDLHSVVYWLSGKTEAA